MAKSLIDTFDLWTTAQTLKTSNRGLSANNQSLLGIKKLRELILELGVRGKLVPQNPEEEPAIILLKKIETEKKRLAKDGIIKKQEELPDVSGNEMQFDLPKGWEWTRLGNLSADIHYGFTASANAHINKVRLLRITDIQDDKVNWDTVPGCEIEKKQIDNYRLDNGDILIARTGGTIGKSYLVSDIDLCSVFASYLIRVKKLNATYPQFIKTYLGSLFYWNQLYKNSMGTGQPNVNGNALKNLVFPLPPLAEQHRIVAKVDELMALCDRLEQQQTSSNEAHQTLVDTLLGTLTNAKNPEDFEKAWQRIANHFDTLITTEHSIDQLKQTILQLAVMAKLVPQNPDDEPASELLKKIAKEKARLVKEGKIKKQAPLPEITDDEKSFELPEGWEWVRLADVVDIEMGQSPDGSSYNEEGIGVPLINGPVEFGPGPFDYTLKTKFTTSPTKMCKKGDLLVCVRGATTGRTNIAGFDACIGRGVASMSPYFEEKYLNYFMLKSRYSILSMGTGTTFPSISKSEIEGICFALPPLAEQHRIVSKVDELFVLCDALKERLRDAQALQNQLAEAVVEQGV